MPNQPVYAPQAQKEFAAWEQLVKHRMPTRMKGLVKAGLALRGLTATHKGKR